MYAIRSYYGTGNDDGGDNSGSIHLFEKQGAQWNGVGEVAKLSASRITSYNVCYTKLLRHICMEIWLFETLAPGVRHKSASRRLALGPSFT